MATNNNKKSSKSFLESFRHFAFSMKMLGEGVEGIGKGIWYLAEAFAKLSPWIIGMIILL